MHATQDTSAPDADHGDTIQSDALVLARPVPWKNAYSGRFRPTITERTRRKVCARRRVVFASERSKPDWREFRTAEKYQARRRVANPAATITEAER